MSSPIHSDVGEDWEVVEPPIVAAQRTLAAARAVRVTARETDANGLSSDLMSNSKPDAPIKYVPLTCHGHTRPITHLNFSAVCEGEYYLLSACKDNNPMLRDGITGDWIGTFFGHKGAVWSSCLSSDSEVAATGSADFTVKIWNAHTGECLHTLPHNHIVKAVAFPWPFSPTALATGGVEKKLRIFDLTPAGLGKPFICADNTGLPSLTPDAEIQHFEVGPGEHTAPIKSIVWHADPWMVTSAAEDRTIRWFDIRTRTSCASYATEKPIGSMELSTLQNPYGVKQPGVLAVAAGNKCLFFKGDRPGELEQEFTFDHDVGSVAVNKETNRFVTGGMSDTWVRVWDYETKELIETQKGHHGPIWTTAFSPDGKLYASGSEDGTVKLWKACKEDYGLWAP